MSSLLDNAPLYVPPTTPAPQSSGDALTQSAVYTPPAAPQGSGIVPNLGAGLLEGEAGNINAITDPAQSMIYGPLSIPVSYAAQGVARLFGMDPARAEQLAKEIRGQGATEAALPPPLGTTLIHDIGDIVGVQPEDITAETGGQKIGRVLARGVATAPIQPGGPVRAVLTGAGSAAGGSAAEALAPDWLKPAAALTGSILGGMTPNIDILATGGGPKVRGPVPDPLQVKDIGTAYYQQIARGNAVLQPKFGSDFIDSIQAGMPQSGWGQAARGGMDPVTALKARLESQRGQPMTLRAAQELDQQIGDLVDEEYTKFKGLTPNGKQLLDVQRNLRGMIDNIQPSDIQSGNAADFDNLSQARDAWAQYRKMNDLQRMWNRAQDTENPTTSMRTQIRNMDFRGYSPDEITAVKNISSRDTLGTAGHFLESRLLGIIGAGVHGAPGAALGYAVSSGARAGMTALQGARYGAALRQIAAGAPAPLPPQPSLGLRPVWQPNRAQLMGHLLMTAPAAGLYGQ